MVIRLCDGSFTLAGESESAMHWLVQRRLRPLPHFPSSTNDSSRHRFVVVYQRAVRDPGRGPIYWYGHVTHVVANPVTLETTERRLAFKHLDELPAIIRRLIGRDTTEFVDQESGAGS